MRNYRGQSRESARALLRSYTDPDHTEWTNRTMATVERGQFSDDDLESLIDHLDAMGTYAVGIGESNAAAAATAAAILRARVLRQSAG
jgi:hypothetical protein